MLCVVAQEELAPTEVWMADIAERAATYEDVRAAPKHLVAEILFGKLVTHRVGIPHHNATVSALQGALAQPLLFGPWISLYRAELHLGPHVVVPDLAAWRREQLSPLPEAWIDTAPVWACEVLSPETEVRDRSAKRAIYAAAGVRYLWLVDPVHRMLEVFELRDDKWLLLGVFHDDAEVAAAPFTQASFPLGLLWPFDSPVEGRK